MKKAKADAEANDWPRPEYTRADLGPLVRGKYTRRIAAASNVVVIDSAVSTAFPNEESVNAALHGLLELTRSTTRSSRGATGRTHKPLVE